MFITVMEKHVNDSHVLLYVLALIHLAVLNELMCVTNVSKICLNGMELRISVIVMRAKLPIKILEIADTY